MAKRKTESEPKKKSTRKKAPRTATGKKADPASRAAAEQASREGLRERTEAGHRAAGRTPPSEDTESRAAGATRVVDEAIRSWTAPLTEDAKLLQSHYRS